MITQTVGNQSTYRQNTQNITFGNGSSMRTNNGRVTSESFPLQQYPNLKQPAPQLPEQYKPGYQAPQAPIASPDTLSAAHTFTDQLAASRVGGGGLSDAQTAKDAEKVKKDQADIASGAKSADEVLGKKFYQDNAFWKGGIMAGLAIMSGASPMDAYKAASAESEKAHVGETLSDNIDDLKKTYTISSIQAAIAANDPSLLKQRTLSLEEQRAQQKEDQAEARQYAQAQTEEQRAYNEGQQAKSWARQDQLAATQREQSLADIKEQRAYQEAQQTRQNQFMLDKEAQKEQATLKKQEVKDQKKEQDLIEAGKAGANLLNSSLDTIEAAANTNSDNLNPIISTVRGGSVGELPTGASGLSAVSGTEARKLYQAAKQIEGSITNMGVAEAKALGASGINTEAELKTFRQAMPQLDYSSVDALKASIKRMREYINTKGKGNLDTSKGALSANKQSSAGDSYSISE